MYGIRDIFADCVPALDVNLIMRGKMANTKQARYISKLGNPCKIRLDDKLISK